MSRIDPEELWNPATSLETDPYTALWAAVFALAVRDIVGPPYLQADGENKRYARMAPRWMDDAENVAPGSFLWLCGMFDFDPHTRLAGRSQCGYRNARQARRCIVPGVDYDVHPLMVGGDRYGCHNRQEFASGYFAPNGFGRFDFIPHRMSVDCRYDNSLADPKCADCRHRGNGERYSAEIRQRGT